MEELRGRVALVTGASRGIGAGVAERLAAEGARVAITARTAQRHEHLPGSLADTLDRVHAVGGTGVAVAGDLVEPDDRARIVESVGAQLGPIDILVNNAAANFFMPFSQYSEKRHRVLFEINVRAPFDLAQRVLPGMRARAWGRIVNVTSYAARNAEGPPYDPYHARAGALLYGMSKAALERFTTGLAAEVYGDGVAVNAVAPVAAVATPGTMALGVLPDDPDLVEDLEVMVEAIVALCACGAELTGNVTTSQALLDRLRRPVMSLDGRNKHAVARSA
jgi:NAD(P)-dependent dehydrogenase (short-subunit alcohol dehydrogenase family)